MKQFLFISFTILFTISSYAQHSFEKGAKVIGVTTGLGIYNYTTRIASTNKSDTDPAASKMYTLFFEYGVKNWLGIGIKGQYSDYYTAKDSITKTTPTVNSLDGGAFINLHVVKTKHVNLLLGADVCYSQFKYAVNDNLISEANGGGFHYNIHFQPRFYFGDHFGIHFNLAYANYNYKNLDFRNNQTNLSDILDLSGGGANLGFGLQVKF